MPSRRSMLLASAALAATTKLAFAAHHPMAKAHAIGGGHHPEAEPDAAGSGSPATTPLGPVDTAARWAVATDFNTGAGLLDKSADARMPPSSMTKLMTATIVYGMLKQGRLKLDQQLPVSERAWRMQGSKMFVPLGAQVPVEDLIRGMIVQSGNDACIVLAEAISGSEAQFVELMNQKAQELNLSNTHFENCTGWPADNHYMSCRDIATLAAYLIRTFPEQYKYDAEKTFKYNGIEQGNRNMLVQKGLADGLKTGHTDAGGFGIVASAERGGRRVILVLNGMSSMHERAEQSERMLEWAFREWENVELFADNTPVESARVYLGAASSVPLVGGQPLLVTVPKGWRNSAQISIAYNTPVAAPIRKGTELGKLTLSGKGVPDRTIPLVAGADVPRMGLGRRALAVVTHYVTGA